MAKILKPFVKNYNMYEIPNTRNCFKIEAKQENKKLVFVCVYRKITMVKQFLNTVPQYDIKTCKMYDKEEALNFVLERYNEYIETEKTL